MSPKECSLPPSVPLHLTSIPLHGSLINHFAYWSLDSHYSFLLMPRGWLQERARDSYFSFLTLMLNASICVAVSNHVAESCAKSIPFHSYYSLSYVYIHSPFICIHRYLQLVKACQELATVIATTSARQYIMKAISLALQVKYQI